MKNIYTLTIYSSESHEYTTVKAYSTLEKAFNGGHVAGILEEEWEHMNVLGTHQWNATIRNYNYRIEKIELD